MSATLHYLYQPLMCRLRKLSAGTSLHSPSPVERINAIHSAAIVVVVIVAIVHFLCGTFCAVSELDVRLAFSRV